MAVLPLHVLRGRGDAIRRRKAIVTTCLGPGQTWLLGFSLPSGRILGRVNISSLLRPVSGSGESTITSTMSVSKRDTVDICKMPLFTSARKQRPIPQALIDKLKESSIFPRYHIRELPSLNSLDPNLLDI